MVKGASMRCRDFLEPSSETCLDQARDNYFEDSSKCPPFYSSLELVW